MIETGFIGFGEAAQAFRTAPSWRSRSCAFDIKTLKPSERPAKQCDYDRCDVDACETPHELVGHAKILLSLVTADQAIAAAASISDASGAGRIYVDFNSVSPGTKIEASQKVAQSGAEYVDGAIMAPVWPAQQAVPILLAGPQAEVTAFTLKEIGFSNVRAVGEEIGKAAAIKMVRSVFVKGVEAVSAECAIAANEAGVLDEVLNSLGGEVAARINYNLERMLTHGTRRAAEMDEVARTLSESGIDPLLTSAAAERHRRLGQVGQELSSVPDELSEKLELIVKRKRMEMP